jgi:hypothetical protein
VRGRAAPGRLSGLAVFALAAIVAAQPIEAGAPSERMEIVARPINQFRIGSSERRFGTLEFVGGIEMTSRGRNFGSLSAFRFLKPGADFIGVADTGFWFFGTIDHDADG